MAERVSTGGNVSFQYQKGHKPQLKKERKIEIEQAYNEYYERRKKEKKRKAIIMAMIIVVIIILILAFTVLRN